MKRQAKNLSFSLEGRLSGYALAASTTGVGLLALAHPAEAKIVYTKAHQVIELDHPLFLDLNHDGITDFSLIVPKCEDCYSSAALVAYPHPSSNGVRTSQRSNWAAAYPAGVRIGPKRLQLEPPKTTYTPWVLIEGIRRNRNSRSYTYFGNWVNVRNRYLGLAFRINGRTHYGWARLNASEQTILDLRAVLTGYAYETVPNKPIITGKTEGRDVITMQPGSLGHLARGAFGNQAAKAKENQ